MRKTGRHVRTGSDGTKPSKVGLRSKPNDKSLVEQKVLKQSKTGDQSPTQLSTPSRQIDPSSELNGDKEGSLQPQKFTIESSVTLTKVRSKPKLTLSQGTNTNKQSFELKSAAELSKSQAFGAPNSKVAVSLQHQNQLNYYKQSQLLNANLSNVKTAKSTVLYNSALAATKMKTTPKLNIMLNNTQSEQSFNNVTIKTQDRHNSLSNHFHQTSGLFLKV